MFNIFLAPNHHQDYDNFVLGIPISLYFPVSLEGEHLKLYKQYLSTCRGVGGSCMSPVSHLSTCHLVKGKTRGGTWSSESGEAFAGGAALTCKNSWTRGILPKWCNNFEVGEKNLYIYNIIIYSYMCVYIYICIRIYVSVYIYICIFASRYTGGGVSMLRYESFLWT